MYQCHKCDRKPRFALMEMLAEHIAGYHLKFTPFECQECSATFGTEFAIVGHYKNVHGIENCSFIYKYFPGCAEIRDEIARQMEENGSFLGQDELIRQPEKDLNEESIDYIEDSSLKIKGEAVEVGEETFDDSLIEELINANKENTMNPMIGNINISEFGSDSILRNVQTLEEVLKRSDDLNNEEKNKKKVRCTQCKALISDQRSSRFYHANTKHIKLPLYQCRGCGKKWYTISRSDVLKHVQAIHRGNVNLIVDHRARVKQQLKMLVELCFPKKNTKGKSHSKTFDDEINILEKHTFDQIISIRQDLEENQLSDEEEPQKKKRRSI